MSEKYYGEPCKNERRSKIIKNTDGAPMVVGFYQKL